MFQKVTLIGRLGQKDLRYTPDGKPVVSYTLATSESFKDKETQQWNERTEWHRLVSFNKAAEHIGQHVEPGDLLLIEGKLKTRKWQSNDGQERYTTEIVVNDFPKKLPKYFKRDAQGATNGSAAPAVPVTHEGPPIESYDDDHPF